MDSKIRFHVLSILSTCRVKFTHIFILLMNDVIVTIYVSCIFSCSVAYKHQIVRNEDQSAKARIKAIAYACTKTTDPSTALVVYWFVGVLVHSKVFEPTLKQKIIGFLFSHKIRVY